jgi:hypothetical protein
MSLNPNAAANDQIKQLLVIPAAREAPFQRPWPIYAPSPELAIAKKETRNISVSSISDTRVPK